MRCTNEFSSWINELDHSLRLRIDQRLQRLKEGNPGFHKRFDQLLEIKWRSGSLGAFRIYCAEMDEVVLLLGGHKDRQSKDIEKAKELLNEVDNGRIRTKIYE